METERHIEKLLRAVAKKRREQTGEPFELHPVARQELLREVARRPVKKPGGGFFAQIFSAFGPRLALALSVVVIVAVGVWLLRPLFRERSAVSSLSALSLRADRAAQKNELITPAAPPESAAPTVVNSVPAPDVGADTTTTVAAGERRSSVQTAAKDEGKKQPAPAPVFKSAPSNEAGANRKLTLAAEAPKPAGATQPGVAPNVVSKSTVTVAPPPPPSTRAVTSEKTWVTDSLAAGNAADKKPGSAAPAFATNGIASSMTFAAADREAQKQVTLQPGAVNTDQATKFNSAINNQAAGKLASNSQRFNRVITAPTVRQRGFGGGSPVAPLLASFRMEQNGQEIRVIDADGSVYSGTWQVTPQQVALPAAAPAATHAGGLHFFEVQPAASSAAVAPALDNNSPAMLNYSFTVSGTNRNLKQKITFSGRFIPLTNALNTANNAGAFNTANNASVVGGLVEGRVVPPLSNVAPPVLLNSRIAGKAMIGEQRQIEVNANPAP